MEKCLVSLLDEIIVLWRYKHGGKYIEELYRLLEKSEKEKDS